MKMFPIIILSAVWSTIDFKWLPNAPEDEVTAYHIYDVTSNALPRTVLAVDYRIRQPSATHTWIRVTNSGIAAMQAQPIIGARETIPSTNSPSLSFTFDELPSGTHYAWIFGVCTGNDNTVHLGLNNQRVTSAENITLPTSGLWTWSNTNSSAQRVTLPIPTTGRHTVQVYMREDGFTFSRLALTQDPDAHPRTNQVRLTTTTNTFGSVSTELTIDRSFAATAENEVGESDLSSQVLIPRVQPAPAIPRTPTGFTTP